MRKKPIHPAKYVATIKYHDRLMEELKNPSEAKAYVCAAIDDGDFRILQMAFLDVLEAMEKTK